MSDQRCKRDGSLSVHTVLVQEVIVSFAKFIFVHGSTVHVWVHIECSFKDTSPVEAAEWEGLRVRCT